MKYLDQIHNEYGNYIEFMHANGNFHPYSFEEWINWQHRVGNLTQQEYNQCYDSEGHLQEPEDRYDWD